MENLKYDDDGFLLSKKVAKDVAYISDEVKNISNSIDLYLKSIHGHVQKTRANNIAQRQASNTQLKATKAIHQQIKGNAKTRARNQGNAGTSRELTHNIVKQRKPNLANSNQEKKTGSKTLPKSLVHRQTPEQKREQQFKLKQERENKKQTELLETLVKQNGKSSGLLSKLGLAIAALSHLFRLPKNVLGGHPGKDNIHHKNKKSNIGKAAGVFAGNNDKDNRKRDKNGRFVKTDADVEKPKNTSKFKGFLKKLGKGGLLTALFAGLDAIDIENNNELTREEKNKAHAKNLAISAGGATGALAGAALGSVIFPGVGTVVGGLVGGFLGAETTNAILDRINEAIDPKLSQRLASKWNNFVDVLSSKWGQFRDFAMAGFNQFINGITEHWGNISNFVVEQWTQFSSFISEHWNNISGFVVEKWGNFTDYITENWGGVIENISNAWDKYCDFMTTVWDSYVAYIKGVSSFFWEKIVPNSWKETLSNIGQYAKSVFDNVWGFLKNAWTGIKEIGEAGYELGAEAVNVVTDTTTNLVTGRNPNQPEQPYQTSNQGGYVNHDRESALSLEKKLIDSGKLANNARSGNASNLRQGVPESVSGGLAHRGIYALANEIANDKDINSFTAFKDSYHIKANSKSKHNQGLAFDITYKNAIGGSGRATINQENAKRFQVKVDEMTKMLEKAGLEKGRDFKIINEYDPSKVAKHTTGGHIHFEFANEQVAEKYFNHLYGKVETNRPSRTINDNGQFERNATLNKNSANAIIARTFESDKSVKEAQELMKRFNAGKIGNLSTEESIAYAAMVASTESVFNYKAINDKGYVGAYQFGAQALEDIGLLKAGSYKKYGNKALQNAENWTIQGGLNAFLNDKALQDKAFVDFSNKNIQYLKNKGLTDEQIGNTGDLAKLMYTLKATHLAGAGGYAKIVRTGQDFHDAYGTSAKEYGQHAAEVAGLFVAEAKRLRGQNSHIQTVARTNIAPVAPKFTEQQVRSIQANNIKPIEPIQINPASSKTVLHGSVKDNAEQHHLVSHQVRVGRTVSNPSIAHVASGGIMDNHVR